MSKIPHLSRPGQVNGKSGAEYNWPYVIREHNLKSIVAFALALLLGSLGAWVFSGSSPDPGEADCQATNPGMETMSVREIQLLDGQGKVHVVTAHIADDQVERGYGYQHICASVVDQTTILFVYSMPQQGRFHMSNVKAPLDIGFFDETGLLIDQQLMHPYADGEYTLYSPNQRFQYALEAKRGYFTRNNLVPGRTRLIKGSIYD